MFLELPFPLLLPLPLLLLVLAAPFELKPPKNSSSAALDVFGIGGVDLVLVLAEENNEENASLETVFAGPELVALFMLKL